MRGGLAYRSALIGSLAFLLLAPPAFAQRDTTPPVLLGFRGPTVFDTDRGPGLAAFAATFEVVAVIDGNTGNTEHQFLRDGFQFGVLIEDPTGGLIFRPHPDSTDVNGWGTSWYLNPFLAGANPGLGVIESIAPTTSGIDVSLTGQVTRQGGLTYGSWDLQGTFSYDPVEQLVSGSGTVDIVLDGTLTAAGADLNVERIASNFLQNVPLQTGAVGNTGDMRHAIVRYAPGAPENFTWIPSPELASHFPNDTSNELSIEVVGELNAVDTAAQGEMFQIAVARKPTVTLTYTVSGDPMIAGLVWDSSEGQNFAADNVGINHLFLKQDTASTAFSLSFDMESTVIGSDSDGDKIPERQAGPSCPTGQTSGCFDNCAFEPNNSGDDIQRDSDGNGRGDACECGNADGNTTVDIFDALHIAQGTLVPPLVTMIHPRACDADGNGRCDIFDALRVAQATLVPPLAEIVQECEAATVPPESCGIAFPACDGVCLDPLEAVHLQPDELRSGILGLRRQRGYRL